MTAYESPLRTPRTPPAGAGGATQRERDGADRVAARRLKWRGPMWSGQELSQQSVNGVLATGTQHSETIPVGAIGNARADSDSRV